MPGILNRMLGRGRRQKPQAQVQPQTQSPGAIKGLMGRRTQVSPVEQGGMTMGTGQPKTSNPTGRGGVLGMLAQKMAGGLANRKKKRAQGNTIQGQMDAQRGQQVLGQMRQRSQQMAQQRRSMV